LVIVIHIKFYFINLNKLHKYYIRLYLHKNETLILLMFDLKNYNYKLLGARIFGRTQNVAPYIGVIAMLLIVHYISVLLYKDYCVINFAGFYNIVLSVSPFCTYLLDIVTICNGSLNKVWYIFGSFVVMKITGVLNMFNIFSENQIKPNTS